MRDTNTKKNIMLTIERNIPGPQREKSRVLVDSKGRGFRTRFCPCGAHRTLWLWKEKKREGKARERERERESEVRRSRLGITRIFFRFSVQGWSFALSVCPGVCAVCLACLFGFPRPFCPCFDRLGSSSTLRPRSRCSIVLLCLALLAGLQSWL